MADPVAGSAPAASTGTGNTGYLMGDVDPITANDFAGDDDEPTGEGGKDDKEPVEGDSGSGAEGETEGEGTDGADDKDSDDTDGEEKEKVEEEEEEEEKEEEEEEKEPETPGERKRHTFKEIKAKFPTIFKEFPELGDAYAQHRQYQQVFPTLQEARDAAEITELHETIRTSALDGDPNPILSALHEADPSRVEPFITNILPTVRKADPTLYYKAIVTPVLREALRMAAQNGQRTGDKNLLNGTLHAAKYLLGDLDLLREDKPPKEDPEKAKIMEQRDGLLREKFETFDRSVRTDVYNTLHDEVLGIIKGLDKERTLTKKVREIIAERVIRLAGTKMNADQSHAAQLRDALTKANRAGYAEAWKGRVTGTYLTGFRKHLNAVARGEVLDALPRRPKKEGETTTKHVPPTGAAPRSSKDQKMPNSKDVDWSKTSDKDFLEGRITLKK